MAAVSSIFFIFVLSFLAMPLPVGVPPLPEDPALLRVAPRDTLAYVQWFGAAEPDRDSRNETEALVAEPQVQHMVRSLLSAIRSSVVREAYGQEVAGELFDLGVTALSRPGCIFLGRLDLPPQPMAVEAGLVINFGDDADKIQLSLRKWEGLLAGSMPPGLAIANQDPDPVDGVRFRALPLPAGGPAVSWAMVDGYLALAIGEDTPAQIVRGLRGDDQGLSGNATFNELHGQVKVARPCMRSFLDVTGLMEMAAANLPAMPGTLLQSLGLHDLKAVISESGLEGEGFTARSLVATSGRTGILKLLEGPGLATDDLAIIPGDASFANVLRVNPLNLYRGVLELLDTVQPGLEDQFRGQLNSEVEQGIGLRLEDDILAHLGDTLSLWNSPSQGGLLFTGLTVAWSLENPEAFQQTFSRLMDVAKKGAPQKEPSPSGRISRNVYLEETEYEGHTLFFLNAVGEEMPFAPAWCVTDTHLLFSLFPQMLKATIDRGLDRDSSLASHPEILGQNTLALSYSDVKQTLELLYPAAHLLAQMLVSEAQREGFDVNISMLPTTSSILPHLGTETATFSSTEKGFLLQRSGTLPFADSVLGGLATPMLFALPSLLFARASAVEAQPIRLREDMRPRGVPANLPVATERRDEPPFSVDRRDQPWLAYDITTVDQVFDPSKETVALTWPNSVTEAEQKEIAVLLDRVKGGGLGAIEAKTTLQELGHSSLFGIVNRLREVDYTDAAETLYAFELNKLLEKITITINVNFQAVPLDQPVDLKVAHWNAQTVKAWLRLLKQYSNREDWDRLIKSIKARRDGRNP